MGDIRVLFFFVFLIRRNEMKNEGALEGGGSEPL